MTGHIRKRSKKKDSWTIILDIGRQFRNGCFRRTQKWESVTGPRGAAEARLQELLAEQKQLRAFPKDRKDLIGAPVKVPTLNHLIRCTRANAKKRKIEWDLSWEDIQKAWDRCGMKCEVTHIPLQPNQVNGPYKPSLDRIDSRRPYTADNIRFVCKVVNYAMNQWGESVLHEMLHAMWNSHESTMARKSHIDALRMNAAERSKEMLCL